MATIILLSRYSIVASTDAKSLTTLGHDVYCYPDSNEFLNSLDQIPCIDLIITEMNLAGSHRGEHIKTLRKMPKFKEVPILVYSSYNHSNNYIEALGATAFLYLDGSPEAEITKHVRTLVPDALGFGGNQVMHPAFDLV